MLVGGVSRRWVASVVRSAGACRYASASPASQLFALYSQENTLHTHRELIRSHNRTLKPQITGNIPLLRSLMTMGQQELSSGQESFVASHETSQHIMNILDNEAVDKVRTEREIPDIRPGYIVQLKVDVPENKRRTSVIKGIVIARRNAGLNTTFRLRRLASGVGVESVFPLYSPSIKEMKVLDKKKVRRAKLYYLRDRMNPLKK